MRGKTLIFYAFFAVLMSSCIYEDNSECISNPTVAKLSVVYDKQWEYAYGYSASSDRELQRIWPRLGFSKTYEELYPTLPDGLRTILYDDDEAIDIRNVSTHGGIVYLYGEDLSMLIFSNDIEYDLVDHSQDVTVASVTTREIERPGYEGSPYAKDATTLLTMPDVLFHGYVPDIEWDAFADTINIRAIMIPLVYTYAVKVNVTQGYQYIAIARGALAGMAEGAWLWDGNPMDRRVSVGFDALLVNNSIEAYVKCFGHSLNDPYATYGLNLELRLTNGKILSYDIDITDQMQYQPRGGVIMIGNIEIPDSIGQQPSGGGFDVKVDDWGGFEDIPIQI